MAYKVFIDGSEGTTGLQLHKRLAARQDIELLSIEKELHRDIERRRELINTADVVFLCLPDKAAVEAVELCSNPQTVIIDASTAHRVNKNWVYGFPELSAYQKKAIASAKRIANPGCYATGAISILYPLISAGIMPKDYPVSINAVSGYSGGGKKMIAAYQQGGASDELIYPRTYGLELHHKHLPEIQQISGLGNKPLFQPQVGNYYAGMAVSIPLFPALLNAGDIGSIKEVYKEHYAGQSFVSLAELPADGFINAGRNTGTNNLSLYVYGNDEQIIVTSILDNLGKGASGAAVQNMNIVLGLEEEAYLK